MKLALKGKFPSRKNIKRPNFNSSDPQICAPNEKKAPQKIVTKDNRILSPLSFDIYKMKPI